MVDIGPSPLHPRFPQLHIGKGREKEQTARGAAQLWALEKDCIAC